MIDLLRKTEKELERECLAKFGKYEVYDSNEEVLELLRAVAENNSTEGELITVFDMKMTRALLELMTNIAVVDSELLDLEVLEKKLSKPSRNLRRMVDKVSRVATEDFIDVIENIVLNHKVVKLYNSVPKEIQEKAEIKLKEMKKESE